jgi:hypothetical protein
VQTCRPADPRANIELLSFFIALTRKNNTAASVTEKGCQQVIHISPTPATPKEKAARQRNPASCQKPEKEIYFIAK